MRIELIMILSYGAFLSFDFKKYFLLTLIRFPTAISITIIQLVAINDCDNYCDHDYNHCNYYCNQYFQRNLYLNFDHFYHYFYHFNHYGTMMSGFGTYGMDSEEVTDGIEHR